QGGSRMFSRKLTGLLATGIAASALPATADAIPVPVEPKGDVPPISVSVCDLRPIGVNVIEGDNGPNVLIGTTDRDIIIGNGGNDVSRDRGGDELGCDRPAPEPRDGP